MKAYILIDNMRNSQKLEGVARFDIKQVDYSTRQKQVDDIIMVDRSIQRTREARKRLLKFWEGIRVP